MAARMIRGRDWPDIVAIDHLCPFPQPVILLKFVSSLFARQILGGWARMFVAFLCFRRRDDCLAVRPKGCRMGMAAWGRL